eukprot:452103-Rhodomonas_salina.2
MSTAVMMETSSLSSANAHKDLHAPEQYPAAEHDPMDEDSDMEEHREEEHREEVHHPVQQPAAQPPVQQPVHQPVHHHVHHVQRPCLALAQVVAYFNRTHGLAGQAGEEWKFQECWLEQTIPADEIHPDLSCC